MTVPDSGIRDEYGIEPMDELFSSPEKLQPLPSGRKSAMKRSPNATITSEEDMDVGHSTIPEPAAVLTERKKRVSMAMPLPRSKSPVKTFLGSPAKRHPSLGPASSPSRPPVASPERLRPQHPMTRRLDFSADKRGANGTATASSPKASTSGTPSGRGKAPRKTDSAPAPESPEPAFEANEEDQAQDYPTENRVSGMKSPVDYEDDYQPFNDDDDGDMGSPEREKTATPPEPTPPRPKKRGRPPLGKTKTAGQNKVGRPKKSKPSDGKAREPVAEKQYEPEEQHEAREEYLTEEEQEEEREPELPPLKRQRFALSAKPQQEPKKKPTPKRHESPPRESSPVQVQRGPPRPKQNGLFILRRETPGLQTRSGRASVKPMAYWKNERVVYGEDDTAENDENFVLPTVKEVIRRDDVEAEKLRKEKKRGRKPHKRVKEDEVEAEEELAEPWETDPGRVYGEIKTWDPEDPVGSETIEQEEELAYSNAAIVTREIPGSSVKFAKTLTLPFFGSGMVDIPPGAIKRPKNSRKMQMVFFVHYGRVKIDINRNVFRISKGGIFQVPRGKPCLSCHVLGVCANNHCRQFLQH